MDSRVEKAREELASYRKTLFDFSGTEFKPFRFGKTVLENGFYLTIRCGLTGIYTTVNEWKDGEWMLKILDGSTTIAYNKNKLNLKCMEDEKE